MFSYRSRSNAPGSVIFGACALALALLPAGGAQAAQPNGDASAAPTTPELETIARPFELMDVFNLEYASDPQMSPDGTQILYVRRSMDIMKDRRRGSIWMVATAGEDHRPVLSDGNSYSSPRWSPDGTRMAYVTSAEGSPQIYVRWMDTGQTTRVAQLTASPSNLKWSPDGSQIAFTMRVPVRSEPLAKLPTPPKGAEWAQTPTVVDRLTYRFDGSGFVPEAYNHIFTVPAEGGTPRQITDGDFNAGAPAWLPDGLGIIFSAAQKEDREYKPEDTDLHVWTSETDEITALTDRIGPDSQPAVAPNGRYVAYVGYDEEMLGFQVSKLYLLDRTDNAITVLTEDLDRSVTAPAWAPDSSGVFFQYDDRGVTKLSFVTSRGRRTDLAEGLGGTSIGRPYPGNSFSVGRNGVYATLMTTPTRPADLAAGSLRYPIRLLTDLNADNKAIFSLSEMSEITFPSNYDDREIQGWYLTPPGGIDPDKKYPLVLEIHGGPFANYGPRFTAEGQLYAAAGYVVLFINPRGSSSYGKEFGNLIHHNYPSQDYDDLMAGVDLLIEQGIADPDRLFVTGGSGGGTLTAWIVGKTDRFKAAVVQKPVINWQSFVLTADFSNFFARYWFPAMPWEEPEHYWARSPLSLAGNVSTPTMLLTGEEDYRTPMSETEQYYQALKLRKVDTAMVRLPGASHSIAQRPSQLMAKVAYILAWFDRYDTATNPVTSGEETPEVEAPEVETGAASEETGQDTPQSEPETEMGDGHDADGTDPMPISPTGAPGKPKDDL